MVASQAQNTQRAQKKKKTRDKKLAKINKDNHTKSIPTKRNMESWTLFFCLLIAFQVILGDKLHTTYK